MYISAYSFFGCQIQVSHYIVSHCIQFLITYNFYYLVSYYIVFHYVHFIIIYSSSLHKVYHCIQFLLHSFSLHSVSHYIQSFYYLVFQCILQSAQRRRISKSHVLKILHVIYSVNMLYLCWLII